jgi:hypothetical protein
MMTATTRQEEILHLSPALRNAQKPHRHPLLKTKSLPSLPQLRELIDTSLHIHRKQHGEMEDSLSSLEDPDAWRQSDKQRLIGLTKKDPKECRLLLSHAQKASLENSDSNLSFSNNDAPVRPFRRRSLLKTESDDTMDVAAERLQQLSMSAPNLRFHMSSLYLDLDQEGDDETQPLTVVTPTRRRNPDQRDREDYPKSPRTVHSEDSQKSEPRVLLSLQQARSFSRRERNRSASPDHKQREAQRAQSSDGHSTRRRTRIRVRALSLDKEGADVVKKSVGDGILQFEPDDEGSPAKEVTKNGDKKNKIQLRPYFQRSGSRRPSRRPLVRSNSKSRTSTSPFRARLQISRQKLMEKLVDAGVAPDQHEEMMAKMGYGLDLTELNQSAEF